MQAPEHSGIVLVSQSACSSLEVLGKLEAKIGTRRWDDAEVAGSGVSPGEIRGLWVRQDVLVSADLVKDLPKLEFVASTTTSILHIDTGALESRGIGILHLESGDPGLENITSTVDHTWALIFHVHGKLSPGIEAVNLGLWSNDIPRRERQLSASVLGVVGLGRVGLQVAKVGKAFGMRVVGFDISADAVFAAEKGGIQIANSLNQVFSESDYVSLHASGTQENFELVDDKILQRAQGVELFNTARGELVDENAVVQSLKSGGLAGYHADVAQFENTTGDLAGSVIYKGLKDGLKITLTPHVGGSTADAMVLAEEIVELKIENFLAETRTSMPSRQKREQWRNDETAPHNRL